MSEQRSRRSVLRSGAALSAAALTGVAGCAGESGGDDSLRVFHAGSLGPPFATAEERFESRTGVDATRESWGSVEATRRVTDQGMRPGVLAVADFRLLRDDLLPEFGNWYAVFATNAMGIQYAPDAPGADGIETGNWWEVLSRDEVTIGHADPALDPGGYRAKMVLELGAVPFRGERLYDEVTRSRLQRNARVTTGNEVNLESQVRSGKVDYAIYYRSLGRSSDLPYLDLQPSVNLERATPEYANHYAEVEVETESGTYTGSPIAYGITVPSVAKVPENGARWVDFLLGETGRSILDSAGFAPMTTPVVPTSAVSTVPDRVLDRVESRSRLGPLRL